MQSQPNDSKQKSVEEEVVKNKFLRPSSRSEPDTTFSKSPWLLSTRSNLLNAHSEIKRRDAMTSVSLRNCDDLLEIRSTKKYSKRDHKNNAESSIITINVSGSRFQTRLSTLELYPNTLLGDENKRKFYWNSESNEYFFDRHRSCFEAILYYYQSHGRLRRPDFVPLDTFLEEISFFQLGLEASTQVRKEENIKEVEKIRMPRKLWRRYIWFYLECPQHSAIARAINLISMFFTILSCVSLALESLPQYNNHWDDICKLEANVSLNSTFTPRCSALFTSPFFIIQTICVTYFTIEFLLRLISTPSYRRFIFSFFTWVDLGAIIPYYVFLGIQLGDKDIGLDPTAILCIRLLRILRFTRIFKIYLIFRRLKSLRVLSATIKESLIDFAVIITILALIAFLFGAATYFAEQGPNGDVFDSIPRATYWGIITITGVGYGDMVPITAIGRTLTCLCALLGSAMMGMLVSVLVDRYQRVYNRKMYVSEPEMSAADFDLISINDDDTRSIFSLQKPSRMRRFSTVISQSLSLIHDKVKHDSHQQQNFQILVSINGNNKDPNDADHIVKIMKKKLSEVISTTDIDVNLQLIDRDCQELWAISSAISLKKNTSSISLKKNASSISLKKNTSNISLKKNTSNISLKKNASNISLSTNTNNKKELNIVTF